jgi:hypothetical protein
VELNYVCLEHAQGQGNWGVPAAATAPKPQASMSSLLGDGLGGRTAAAPAPQQSSMAMGMMQQQQQQQQQQQPMMQQPMMQQPMGMMGGPMQPMMQQQVRVPWHPQVRVACSSWMHGCSVRRRQWA